MHLIQPECTYSCCGSFTKNKGRMQKFKEARDSRSIYSNKLDKACIQHEMAYRGFKYLLKIKVSDKVLLEKHLILLKTHNMIDIKRALFQGFMLF